MGITKVEAKPLGIPATLGKQTMMSNARTLISSGQPAFVKLVADAGSRKLLGAQLYCQRVGDIVAELILATGDDCRGAFHSVRPHPNFCEAVAGAADNLLKKL